MEKNKAMAIVIIVIVSVLLIFLISKILINNSDINQGKFRVNDVVLRSTLDVEEISSNEDLTNGFENMTLNLSQRNNISMLIANKANIKDIYIDNISITEPASKGEVVVYQNNAKDEKIDYSSDVVAIYPDEKEGQILINLNIDNVDFLKDVKIPDGTNAITFDGTLLKTLEYNLEDLNVKVKFNLNIVDESGKVNVCKFKFTFPEGDLINNGISIKRQNLNDYKFTVGESFIDKLLNIF